MKKLLTGAAVAATLTLGACSSMGIKSEPTTYAEITAAAKATHAEAKKMKNVWKQKKMKKAYVDFYLAKAEAAKKKGDEKAAMKYAKLALKVARAEVDQINRYAGEKPMWEK